MIKQSLLHSFLFHTALVILFFILTFNQATSKKITTFNFKVIEKKTEKKKEIQLKKPPKIVINGEKTKEKNNSRPNVKKREVFGVKRKTLTSKKGIITAKVGNTLTKKEDNKILKDSESDRLPQPTEEFLVTSMPRPLNEIRPEYPSWAKEQKISGRVIFDILIDEKGKVRQATLLRGIHPELDNIAKDAMMKFKFRPAYIDNKPVTVKIKYAIKFILES